MRTVKAEEPNMLSEQSPATKRTNTVFEEVPHLYLLIHMHREQLIFQAAYGSRKLSGLAQSRPPPESTEVRLRSCRYSADVRLPDKCFTGSGSTNRLVGNGMDGLCWCMPCSFRTSGRKIGEFSSPHGLRIPLTLAILLWYNYSVRTAERRLRIGY